MSRNYDLERSGLTAELEREARRLERVQAPVEAYRPAYYDPEFYERERARRRASVAARPAGLPAPTPVGVLGSALMAAESWTLGLGAQAVLDAVLDLGWAVVPGPRTHRLDPELVDRVGRWLEGIGVEFDPADFVLELGALGIAMGVVEAPRIDPATGVVGSGS